MEQGAGGEQPRGVSANKAYSCQGRGPCKSMSKEGRILSRLTKYSKSRKYANSLRNFVYTIRPECLKHLLLFRQTFSYICPRNKSRVSHILQS